MYKNEKINDKNISDKNSDMNITVDDDNNTTYIFFVTVFI